MKPFLKVPRAFLLYITFTVFQLRFSSSLYLDGYELKDLNFDGTDFSNDALNWLTHASAPGTAILDCNGEQLIAGDPTRPEDQILGRTYSSLPPHTMVHAVVTVWCIDDWNVGDTFQINIGDLEIQAIDTGNLKAMWPSNICGQGGSDTGAVTFFMRAKHSGDTLEFNLTTTFQSTGLNKILAIRDVNLLFSNHLPNPTPDDHQFCSIASFLGSRMACLCEDGYQTSDNSCEFCDDACSSCFGPDATDCYACTENAFFNGTHCIYCDPTCQDCSGSLPTQCISCPPNNYLYNDGTCQPVCDPPYSIILEKDVYYCRVGCASDEFTYQNDSCLTSCETYFIPRVETDGKYCDFPCDSSEFLSYDGNCVTLCDSPFVPRIEGIYHYCDFPCESNEFLTYNNTCQPSCEDRYVHRMESGFKYCELPCTSTEFLYPNGSCIKNCVAPWQQSKFNDVLTCEMPCADSSEYLYSNGTCSLDCSSPFIQDFQVDIRTCIFPCDPSNILYYNNTCLSSQCQYPFIYNTLGSSEYQTCNTICQLPNFLLPSGLCDPICPFPFIGDNDTRVCKPPCNNSSDYFYPAEEICKSQCNSPLEISLNETVKICTFVKPIDSHDIPRKENNSLQVYMEVSSVLGSITSIGSALHMSLASGNPTALVLSILMEMFMYIRYLGIRYPSILQELLNKSPLSPLWITFAVLMPQKFKDSFTSSSIPQNFSKYGLQPRFLPNWWTQISYMTIVFIVAIISDLLVKFLKRFKLNTAKEILRGIRIITRWNLLVLMYCCYTPSLYLYASLEFKSFQFNTASDVVCFILCNVAIFASLSLIIFNFSLARKWMRIKNSIAPLDSDFSPQKSFIRNWQRVQVLFIGYKDDTIYQKMFVTFYVMRIMSVYLVVVWLFEYPLVQTCVITSLSLIMLLYLFKIKPIPREGNKTLIIYETIILIPNLCVLALSILDKLTDNGYNSPSITDSESTLRVVIGMIVIMGNLMFTLTSLYFLGKDFISKIKYSWGATKQLKRKGSRFWLQLFAIIFQRGGMSFDQVNLQEISPPKHVTFRPRSSPNTKKEVSSFSHSKIVPSDFSRNKSVTPLLKKNPQESSVLNLSDSKMSHYKSTILGDIFHDGPLKDLSDIETKSPKKQRRGLNLSVLTSSPMSFWSVSPKKASKNGLLKSTTIINENNKKSPKSIELDSGKFSPALAEQNNQSWDFEYTPLRALGSTPKIASRGMLGPEDLCTIDETKEVQEDTGRVSKTRDLRVDFLPLSSFRKLNVLDDNKSVRSKNSIKRKEIRTEKEEEEKNKENSLLQKTLPDQKESMDLEEVGTVEIRRLRTFAEERDRKGSFPLSTGETNRDKNDERR